ncbi:hypothetical protein FSP39_010950 [Pinctada imbricata]|uniref:SAP domain-containing protein n=1 Tax=Pinctada imbricata TaxID=66713 RepID=A0AA88XFA3_PINIB|nr:hypothetical protein FSP39_010950 [Pinctada imbricata]
MQKRMEESKYGSYTIPQLKEELRKRNARLTGRKRELVERLIAYDRNSNFGKQEITEPKYSMSLPKSETYCDVNSDSHFSGLNMETLNNYLENFDEKFDSHASQQYNEKFLRYYRSSQQSDKTFIKASCRAEMRKGVSYTVDIELGQRCSIIESQCQNTNIVWKEERAKRITSSMFERICKAMDKTDKPKLAKNLTLIRNIKAASIEHGGKHEPIAIEHFMKITNKEVKPSGLVVCKDHPFLAASPDGIISTKELVEIKCPYVSREREISEKNGTIFESE